MRCFHRGDSAFFVRYAVYVALKKMRHGLHAKLLIQRVFIEDLDAAPGKGNASVFGKLL